MPDTASTALTSVEGYVILEIKTNNGDFKYTLDGSFGHGGINVAYNQPFEKALNLGELANIIADILTSLTKALGIPVDSFGFTSGDELKGQLGNIPVLSNVVNALLSANLIITNIVINTQVSPHQYKFGFGLDFSGEEIKVGPVALDGIGFVFSHTGAAAPV